VQRAQDARLPACDDGLLPSTCLTSLRIEVSGAFVPFPAMSKEDSLQIAI
jgi:hypothetical protein